MLPEIRSYIVGDVASGKKVIMTISSPKGYLSILEDKDDPLYRSQGLIIRAFMKGAKTALDTHVQRRTPDGRFAKNN